MNQLETAVRNDLANATEPPPLERVTQRARRAQMRRAGSGVLSLAAIVVIALVALLATRSHGGLSIETASTGRVAASTSTTKAPAVPSLPLATEESVPGLDGVLASVRHYGESDGPVDSAEIVATTTDKTFVLFGGQQGSRPIYLVRLTGHFVCNECSVPPGAHAPHGNEIMFTVPRHPTPPLDATFEVGSRAVDLAAFGTVYRLPPAIVSARIVLPATTLRSGATMKAHVVIENDTGRSFQLPGCNGFLQLALGNATVVPNVVWLDCLMMSTIPTGTSSYRVDLPAFATTCFAPIVGGHCPGVPAGKYTVRLYQDGGPKVPAPPVAVRVTP